jgi:uncharacterized membrane protein YbhN (UPF0104 family)
LKLHIPKYVKTAIKIILSLGILGFVLYKIDLQQLADVFKRTNFFYLFVALLFFALSKFISAFRLNRFLTSVGINISDKFNIKLYLLGMFYNLFLPGGIGGDGYKIYLLNKRSDIKAKKIFWAILLDRVMGLLALFCLAAGLAIFIPIPEVYKYYVWILIPLGIVAYFIFIRYWFSYFQPIFFKTLGQSFLVQLSQVASAIFILMSIQTFDNTSGYIFVFLVSSIVAAMPITIGGIGSREITFLLGAEIMHLNISNSIALSLLFYIITAVVSLVGGYYSIKSDRLK